MSSATASGGRHSYPINHRPRGAASAAAIAPDPIEAALIRAPGGPASCQCPRTYMYLHQKELYARTYVWPKAGRQVNLRDTWPEQ